MDTEALCGGASTPHLAAKERYMSQSELRRKLSAFPTGGLLFRIITRF